MSIKLTTIFCELNIQGFDFSYGFKCSDVHKINELNNLSINIFELNFYQDQNKWKYKLSPFEISENISDRVIDLAIYTNHYFLIKKLDVFLGDHNKKIICRCRSTPARHAANLFLRTKTSQRFNEELKTINITN